MMFEIFNSVKCYMTIILNSLPTYKFLLFCFLLFPIYPITTFKNRNPQIHSIVFSFLLLGIWIIQVLLWNNLILFKIN
jgi:hypothetical protein